MDTDPTPLPPRLPLSRPLSAAARPPSLLLPAAPPATQLTSPELNKHETHVYFSRCHILATSRLLHVLRFPSKSVYELRRFD